MLEDGGAEWSRWLREQRAETLRETRSQQLCSRCDLKPRPTAPPLRQHTLRAAT